MTANLKTMKSKEINALAEQVGTSDFEAMYCLVLRLKNTTILNGTKTVEYKMVDLNALRKVYKWASKDP